MINKSSISSRLLKLYAEVVFDDSVVADDSFDSNVQSIIDQIRFYDIEHIDIVVPDHGFKWEQYNEYANRAERITKGIYEISRYVKTVTVVTEMYDRLTCFYIREKLSPYTNITMRIGNAVTDLERT